MVKTNDLSLSVAVEDISNEPRRYRVVASEADKSALVERFGIVALETLEADIEVRSTGKPFTIWVTGKIASKLTQQCIATLGEVPEVVDEEFELMLVSQETADHFDAEELYTDPDAPDYDAFEGDELALGETVAQTLSVFMNPYPRHPDADIGSVAGESISVNEELEKRPNPFSTLAKLRDKS